MTPILVLLGLLSAATIATRRVDTRFAAHIAATPLLLAIGVAIAPARLGFITPSTLDALSPALRVGAAWLAVLVGLRSISPTVNRDYVHSATYFVTVGLTTWALLAAVAYGLLLALVGMNLPLFAALTGPQGPSVTLGLSVFLGGVLATSALAVAKEAFGDVERFRVGTWVLFLYRHDEVFGALGLCAVMWLWPLPVAVAPIYAVAFWPALAVVGLGAMLAMAQGLLGAGVQINQSGRRVALLGLTTLCCGLAVNLRLPEAAIGYFFGAFLGTTGVGKTLLAGGVSSSERPVRLAVFVLVGVSLQFSWAAVLAGVGIALVRLVLKTLLRFVTLHGFNQPKDAKNVGGDDVDPTEKALPLCGFLGIGGTAIPFAASFALSRAEGPSSMQVLTVVAVAVGITDVVSLILWKRQERKMAGASEQETSERDGDGGAGQSRDDNNDDAVLEGQDREEQPT